MRDRLRRAALDQDADLLVEGEVESLARRVSDALPTASVRLHPRFGTASITVVEGWRIDLARARRETYRRSGALPDVQDATLEEDLARRDFSVNAMAWELPGRGSSRGRLHDPFGGAKDLAAGRLRILHPDSFLDDPTRILRAVRYANRLGLRMEPATRRRLTEALAAGAFDWVSGDRIRRELERTLGEERAAGALTLASGLGILRALAPSWAPTPVQLRSVARAQALAGRVRKASGSEPRMHWMVPLLVSTASLSEAGRRELAARLSLAGESRLILERFGPWSGSRSAATNTSATGRESNRPTLAERIASAVLAPAGSRRKAEGQLLREPIRISIGGRDLVDAGVPAGPRIGRALAETRRAREEGRIRQRDELSFALASARREESGQGEDRTR